MTELWPAFATAGVGFVLLGLVLAAVRPHVRRFTTAAAALRAALARGTAALTARRDPGGG